MNSKQIHLEGRNSIIMPLIQDNLGINQKNNNLSNKLNSKKYKTIFNKYNIKNPFCVNSKVIHFKLKKNMWKNNLNNNIKFQHLHHN